MGMPAKWRARIKEEFEQGDPRALLLVTADIIRAARRKAKKDGLTFGFGSVVNLVHAQAANGYAAESAKAASVASAADRQADVAERDGQKREIDQYWKTLSPVQQKDWHKAAREKWAGGGKSIPAGPRILESLARSLAWKARNE